MDGFPIGSVQGDQGRSDSFQLFRRFVEAFLRTCGTGLYFINEEMLPGIVDIQSATLDDAHDHPPGAQIQTAERLGYMADLANLAEFERYPGP